MKTFKNILGPILLICFFSNIAFASGITESLNVWTFGLNQPQIDSGARGDGTMGRYHYLPVGTDAYYYEAPTTGEGSITFWVYDPGKCLSNPNPGFDWIGPMWGLRNQNSQALAVGIARQNYVAGCLGYSPWSTVAPDNPFWFHDGVRATNGIMWAPGWFKWDIDGKTNNISFTLYDVCYDDGNPGDDLICGPVTMSYDATTNSGIWASLFGFGWNGMWLKGDGTNGIEDIKVDVVSGSGIFTGLGRDTTTATARPYQQSTWGNIKALFER